MATKVLLIVPAYNEEANIAKVARTIDDAGYDFVVICDGSTDGTLAACRAGGIPVVELRQNLGIGGAVQTGHRYALEHGYDADVQFDGDGQHDISFVPALVEALSHGADLAIGSRFLEQTGGFKSTRMRRAGIRWLRGWLKLFTGLRVTDATSGFRACGRRAMELFAADYPDDYPEPESIVSAHRAGMSVCEVPVAMKERTGGTSSISASQGVYYMVKVSLAIAIAGLAGRNTGSSAPCAQELQG